MSSLAEFNSSDGLPPLVMQKLNRDFKYLYSLIAGTDQPVAISVGSSPPTPRTDEVFWYDTSTGMINTWAGNEEDGYEWTSLDPSIYIAIEAIAQEAYEIATAMECRCYRGGSGRTRMKTIHMGRRDVLAFIAIALVIGGVILCNIFLGKTV